MAWIQLVMGEQFVVETIRAALGRTISSHGSLAKEKQGF